MDYEAAQTLANDLLGDGSNFDLRHAGDMGTEATSIDQQDGLHAPGLWSDSGSEEAGSDAASEEDSQIQTDINVAALKANVRAAVRFKRGSTRRGPRKGQRTRETMPTFEVQGMLGRANQCYVVQDLDNAQAILQEIIRIDHNVFAAWQLLGEVHQDRGDLDKCMIAWMTAAHLRQREPSIWQALVNLSIQKDLVDQADYCYQKLCKACPQDVDIVWDRAIYNRDHGQTRKSIEILRQLLKLIPYEMTTVREMAKLYLEQDRVEEAVKLYEDTSNFYMSGDSYDTFNWSELNIMAELYISAADASGRLDLWRTLINRIKIIARWLRGRQFEVWWNDRNDDAEWDHDDTRREEEVRFTNSSNKIAYILPIELRLKLGRARLVLKDKSEAMRHFDFLDNEDAEEMSDLFLEVADNLLKFELWDEALDFYSKLTEVEDTNTPMVWYSMAKAYKAIGIYDQAEECLDAVMLSEPDHAEALVLLAEIYEYADRRDEALELINRVIELRKTNADEDDGIDIDDYHSISGAQETAFFQSDIVGTLRSSDRPRRPRRRDKDSRSMKQEDLAAYEMRKTADTKTKFKALELSWSDMLLGNTRSTEQWMSAAADLVDDFRNIRHFYPAEKQHVFQGVLRSNKSNSGFASTAEDLQGIAHRLEESITADRAVNKTASQQHEFRGIHFSDWLKIYLQYVLLLANAGQHEDAHSLLEAAANANVFYQDHKRFMRIQMMKMALAISARDEKLAAEQGRWLMLNCLFREDGFRMYGTALASGIAALRIYSGNANHKFLLRLVKTMDSILTGNTIANTISVKDLDSSEEGVRPRQAMPLLLVLYGHITASGGAYVPALHYFARAYALAPQEPFLLFSIGLSYLHRSMQRQSDNRHLQIVQAFSFLFKYYDLRTSSGHPEHEQEAEYNIGRALHQLGLLHLALPYYERAMHVAGVSPRHDLTSSAVYNMQMIYVLAGNPDRAHELVRRCLTI